MGMIELAEIPAETASARKALFELQVEQHAHDERYHREIARLSLHQRLNHMALHFAKYTGKVAAARSIKDALPVFVDVLIIALSTSNILNVELWDDLLDAKRSEYPSLLSFGRDLAEHQNAAHKDHAALLFEMAIAAGRIAAACEKIDHLEEISFRAEIRAGVATLGNIALATLAMRSIDPGAAVRERLSGVKQRLKLHGRV